MNCDYCREREGIETIYNKIYGNRNRVVYETENFCVFPCIGQLREGHLLVASKEHVNAIGMLRPNVIVELEQISKTIAAFFKKQYNQELLCFEHGVLSDEGMNGGCGIYHMHLHLLPASYIEFSDVLRQVKIPDTNTVQLVPGFTETCHFVAEGKTYIFLGHSDKYQNFKSYVISNSNNYFESQYMRKIICNVFQKSNWDWRQVIQEEPEFLNTLGKSRAFFLETTPQFL